MEYLIRPYKRGEEEYVADLHKRLYSQEYSWGPEFTDYAVGIPRDFGKKPQNDREELFVAEQDGQLAGCIMLCQTDEWNVGQLRLFAVEQEYRRCGIGKALINAFMGKARSAGYTKLILWTADPLTAAIRHYERMGFKTVETVENHTWSTDGITVYEVKMEMDLG